MKRIIVLLLWASCCVAQSNHTENILLITYDGLRWEEVFEGADEFLITNREYIRDSAFLVDHFWAETGVERRQKLLPFIWEDIATNGQLYGYKKQGQVFKLKNPHWFSYPGYNEILTGIADPSVDSNDKIPNKNITILEHLNKKAGWKGKTAAFCSWDVFPYIINEERSEVPVNAGYEEVEKSKANKHEAWLNTLQSQIPPEWGSVRYDAFTHHFALEYLRKNKPRFLYVGYGETDDFAHDGDYENYLISAKRTDDFIREIWDWMQQDPQYKNKTTLIITTDHGRGKSETGDWMHHGSAYPESEFTWLAVLGPDTPARGIIQTESVIYADQIAATIAGLLNITDFQKQQTGSPIPQVGADSVTK